MDTVLKDSLAIQTSLISDLILPQRKDQEDNQGNNGDNGNSKNNGNNGNSDNNDNQTENNNDDRLNEKNSESESENDSDNEVTESDNQEGDNNLTGTDTETDNNTSNNFSFGIGASETGFVEITSDELFGSKGKTEIDLSTLKTNEVKFEIINNKDLKIVIIFTNEYLYIKDAYNDDTRWGLKTFQFSDRNLTLKQILQPETEITDPVVNPELPPVDNTNPTDNGGTETPVGENTQLPTGDGTGTTPPTDTPTDNGTGTTDNTGGTTTGENTEIPTGTGENTEIPTGETNETPTDNIDSATYVFSKDSVSDTINNLNNVDATTNYNTLILKDLSQSDVSITIENRVNLLITITQTNVTLKIENAFAKDGAATINSFVFSDGTIPADKLQIFAITDVGTALYVNQGTDGDDNLDTSSDISDSQGSIIGLAGNDTLQGGAGDDFLSGGLGNDSYVVKLGSGNDSISETNESGANIDVLILKGLTLADVSFQKTNDTDLTIVLNASGETVQIIGAFNTETAIESFQFDDSSLTMADVQTLVEPILVVDPPIEVIDPIEDTVNAISGSAIDETLIGTDQDDAISGNAGNDTLDGGLGNDQLKGGVGDDSYIFTQGSGYDSIDETDSSGAGGNDTVILKGIAQADVDLVKSNSDLYITLKNSDDSLSITGAFDNENNLAIESFEFADGTILSNSEVNDSATEVLYSEIYYSTVDGVLYDKEIAAPSTVKRTLNGTDDNDLLQGTTDNEILLGLAGNDTIRGDAGDDQLSGGAGADRLRGGTGDDLINGGEDNDVLFSGQGNDQLEGYSGNDTLFGGVGENTLSGGEGHDSLYGRKGDDLLIGNAGDDALRGGEGDDVLLGGVGRDFLRGGYGDDTFILNDLKRIDRIADFTSGSDKIQLDHKNFAALTVGELNADNFSSATDVVNGITATNYLIYNTTTGGLYYDADANGADPAIEIAILAKAPELTIADLSII
ncbi:MAG: hypothetical protein RL637_1537 [Pseudomonadota bacterium]